MRTRTKILGLGMVSALLVTAVGLIGYTADEDQGRPVATWRSMEQPPVSSP